MRKVLSLILLILGIVAFTFGNHISQKVNQAQERISQAQENNQRSSRPIVGPVRRNINAAAEESAQRKIGQAEQKIGQSQTTAHWLYGIGIALFVGGVINFILSYSAKKRS